MSFFKSFNPKWLSKLTLSSDCVSSDSMMWRWSATVFLNLYWNQNLMIRRKLLNLLLYHLKIFYLSLWMWSSFNVFVWFSRNGRLKFVRRFFSYTVFFITITITTQNRMLYAKVIKKDTYIWNFASKPSDPITVF